MVMKMSGYYSVAKRVKELRLKYNLSQEQLALRAEITPAYLGQIERGEKNPTVVTVEKLCNALGLSLSDFFSTQEFSESQDSVLNEIGFELKGHSPEEKHEVLQIIKHALKLKSLT